MPEAVHFYLRATFPDATRFYSSGGLAIGETGPSAGKVLSWSPITRGVSSRGRSLESYSIDVAITDTDRDFAKLVTGSQGHLVEGSLMRLYREEALDVGSLKVWEGYLESWAQTAPLVWTLSIALEDRALRREVTPKSHLNVGLWSHIHPTAANLRGPIIYGKHSSISVTNEGFLDAVYVDVKRFRYLVGVGVLKAVTCVYVDGTPASTDDYTVINPIVDGRIYTVVEFSEGLDAATVSVDCEGLTDNGAGGGTLMENPATILSNLLNSFVYGDWKQGAWLTGAPIDSAMLSLVQGWFTNRGWRASYRIACPISGLELISSFCESHEIKAFWTRDGDIGLRIEDPNAHDYAGFMTFRSHEHKVFKLDVRGDRLADRIDGEYVRDEIAGQFAEQLQVRDVVLEEVEDRVPTLERVDLDWSAAFVVDSAPGVDSEKQPNTTTDFPGSNLQYWYKADAETYNDGDAVGSVTDQSGNARHLTQATAARKPTFRTGRCNGRAVYEFDGLDDFVEGAAAWTTLHPNGTWTYFIIFKPYIIQATEDAESGFVGHHIHGPSDQDFEGVHVGASGGGKTASTTLSTSGGVAHATQVVNENDWVIATIWADTTYELHMRIGRGDTVTVAAASRTAGSGNIRWGRLGDEAEEILASQAPPPDSETDPPISRYFSGEIQECFGYNITLNQRQRDQMLDYLESRAIPRTPAQMEQALNVLSRQLWMKHRPKAVCEISVPINKVLDPAAPLEVLDRVSVASPFGPEPTGVGWGRGGAQWRLRSFTVQKIELHPDAGNAILTLLDRRHVDALIWDTGYKRLASGRVEAGVARFYPDVTRTFTRPSKAYVSSPADADVVVAVPYNLPAISYDGELFEAGATNFLLRSSLKEGTTGLTLSGTGVNGSAIATDTTELLFDQDITKYALKFTAGNPHTSELSARWPDTESIDYGFYGQEFRLSVDHMDDSGATLYFRVKRLVDNQFWNDSSETWGSTVDNPITNSTTRARFSSSIIDIGAADTVIQLELLQQSGGTASRMNRVFHVQLENQLCAGSRIVTDDVKFQRAATILSYTQISNARRCYQEDQGTFFCEVIPFFDSDDGLGGTIYNIEYPDEPIVFQHNLSYDTSTDVFKFTVFIDPNTYAATFSQTVTRGTVYKVACRWTYDSGELDLPNYTYSVFVNGVKGTDDTGEAPPTITWAGELLNFGVFNGIIRRRCLIPYPMTDEEIARFEV